MSPLMSDDIISETFRHHVEKTDGGSLCFPRCRTSEDYPLLWPSAAGPKSSSQRRSEVSFSTSFPQYQVHCCNLWKPWKPHVIREQANREGSLFRESAFSSCSSPASSFPPTETEVSKGSSLTVLYENLMFIRLWCFFLDFPTFWNAWILPFLLTPPLETRLTPPFSSSSSFSLRSLLPPAHLKTLSAASLLPSDQKKTWKSSKTDVSWRQSTDGSSPEQFLPFICCSFSNTRLVLMHSQNI